MTNTALRPYGRTPDLNNSAWFLGQMLISFMATGQDTNGQLALLEIRSRKGAEPPPHVHPAEDEYFYILAGELDVVVDGERFAGKPGSFVAVPRGTLHELQLRSDEVRRLTFFTPAGPEGFFRELAEPAGALTLPAERAAPLDVERMAATAARYGIVFPDRPDNREREEISTMTNTAVRPYARKPELENSAWYQGGVLLSFLATAQDTGGQFTLIEIHSRQGDGPLPHIHPAEDEYFYVLEGEMAFDIDGQRYPAPAGSFVMIPRGTLHQPLLVSDEARALMLFTPAGSEGYFQEMSEPARALTLPPADSAPPDLERMARIATKYGVIVPEGDSTD